MASSAELDITVCLSRWRPSFFEIHHDHEVNIIYGGFGGMCTRCIRRSHWSLNSARVHRPVKVPHSGFVRTLLPRSYAHRRLSGTDTIMGKYRKLGTTYVRPETFPAGLNRGRRILFTNNRATSSGKPRFCRVLLYGLALGGVSIPYATVPPEKPSMETHPHTLLSPQLTLRQLKRHLQKLRK